MLSLQTCESTNPTAAYYDTPHGNVSNCTFVFDVRWGDGGDTTTTLTDPVAGHDLVGDRTYARPGAYTITVTVNVTAGPCTGTNSDHAFFFPGSRNIFERQAGLTCPLLPGGLRPPVATLACEGPKSRLPRVPIVGNGSAGDEVVQRATITLEQDADET